MNFPRDIFLKKEFWTITLAVALIAILETLLSGQIADSMTHTKFNRPKEVFGLGIANIVSGLFGGIPQRLPSQEQRSIFKVVLRIERREY